MLAFIAPLALTLLPPLQEAAQDPAMQALAEDFAAQGIELDLAHGRMSFTVQVTQRYEPLEYLLCLQPQGKDYESLFSMEATSAEAINTAMLLLGAEVGTLGRLEAIDPPPTPEAMQQGAMPYTFEAAHGGRGFRIFVEWDLPHEDGQVEHYRYHAEDLVLNVRDETTYRRGPFVYFGSRFVKPHKDADELYLAQAEGNLISLVHFPTPDQLLVGSDPSCDNQMIWYPNLYLLPPIGTKVRMELVLEAAAPEAQ